MNQTKEGLEENPTEELYNFIESLNGRCLTCSVPVPKAGVRKVFDEHLSKIIKETEQRVARAKVEDFIKELTFLKEKMRELFLDK